MDVGCVWEHNGNDSMLYATNYPGAFTRGASKEEALMKMEKEICLFSAWLSEPIPQITAIEIVQNASCNLNIKDADTDVLFESEKAKLTMSEYQTLKRIALKSASDFLTLYEAFPNKHQHLLPARTTFYGKVPQTAEEMYQHTKNVNGYYFGEIGVEANNAGTILECRQQGFEELEKQLDFLSISTTEGSYGEKWSLRKVLRRFIWHDRIHAKALYRNGVKFWGNDIIPNVFKFS